MFEQEWQNLPVYLSNHLLISVLPLSLGILISVPLAILAYRSLSLRTPLLSAVSIIQTIPSLALLALIVPCIAYLNGALGTDIATLGFYPTIIALTLYSMLPIVRNTLTGLTSVDPSLTEAARGVGMTRWQSLTRVELPLCLPTIVAGIRTATVWTVGIATLATPVGQTCLGNYIFTGLQTQTWSSVVFGCLAAAALAIALDWLVSVIEKQVSARRLGYAGAIALGIAALVAAGLAWPNWMGSANVGLPIQVASTVNAEIPAEQRKHHVNIK